MTTQKRMRDVFITKLYEQMSKNKKIFFVAADFGSPKLDAFKADYKDHFINVGIAEQNLINVSVGLALEGYTVYCYAIAPFLTMRPYEQIHNNVSLLSHGKKLNINLVGVGAGLSYDVSGPSHHCLADISAIRSLPNLTVFSPSDCSLVEAMVTYSMENKHPKYFRLDGKPTTTLYDTVDQLLLKRGFAELLRGQKVVLVATGFMTHTAKVACQHLVDRGVQAGLIDVFKIDDSICEELGEKLAGYEFIVTLEEGFIRRGGLDSLITLVTSRNQTVFSIGFNNKHVFDVGNREYLHKINKLDAASIAQRILKEGVK